MNSHVKYERPLLKSQILFLKLYRLNVYVKDTRKNILLCCEMSCHKETHINCNFFLYLSEVMTNVNMFVHAGAHADMKNGSPK